jgi:hypothetical protein
MGAGEEGGEAAEEDPGGHGDDRTPYEHDRVDANHGEMLERRRPECDYDLQCLLRHGYPQESARDREEHALGEHLARESPATCAERDAGSRERLSVRLARHSAITSSEASSRCSRKLYLSR